MRPTKGAKSNALGETFRFHPLVLGSFVDVRKLRTLLYGVFVPSLTCDGFEKSTSFPSGVITQSSAYLMDLGTFHGKVPDPCGNFPRTEFLITPCQSIRHSAESWDNFEQIFAIFHGRVFPCAFFHGPKNRKKFRGKLAAIFRVPSRPI